MNERTQRLLELMEQHRLEVADVAEILGRAPQTVRIWRCDNQVIPADALRVLELTIESRSK
jgi:transcriptional regulator with XRE-family HTH domain